MWFSCVLTRAEWSVWSTAGLTERKECRHADCMICIEDDVVSPDQEILSPDSDNPGRV